jgi:predicted metal-dependent HD superfamily phosphohydrolase
MTDIANCDLLEAWQALIRAHTSVDARDTGRALLASWAEPDRRYHTADHLRDVLSRVDELAAHASDPDAVRLAAWYHDAVYRGAPDDEENSARRAEAELTALGVAPALVAEVARLVRLTAAHDPPAGDRNGETLSDADLAILAVEPERYRRNTAAVRAEYAHVPEDTFRSGRARIIRALLAAPALYRTPVGRHQWEQRARANLAAELRDLAPGGMHEPPYS